jgi:serine/threonine protein kinase
MPCVCVCACGGSWPLPHDFATFAGELALACPACGAGAVRLLLGPPENLTQPPARYGYSTEEAIEPELVEDEPASGFPGQYELLQELGRGGMGVVYKARQRGLNRIVALKMILAGDHAGEEEVERFRVEAEAIARLHHPNIVQVYDIGERNGLPYFSLEFCDGGSLEARLRGKPLPPRDAAAAVETLARAVQAAHDHGIVHRDLKPANVLLASGGLTPPEAAHPPGGSPPPFAGVVPKITDFGLAKKLDQQGHGRTRTGAVMGTPSYMSPEQAQGKKEIGPAADIYALGAILYECLTGRPPFQAATSLDTILQVISEEPLPPRRLNSKVPRDLEVLCLKCLHKEPGARFGRAADLADELRRYLDGDAIRTRPPGIVRRTWKTMRKRPIYAVFLILLSVGALLGVWDYARYNNLFKVFDPDEAQRIFNYVRSDKDAAKKPIINPTLPKK